jgi:dihydrofolate reductase
MGSNTYTWLLDHLGRRDDGSPVWPYAQPSWVFTSRTLDIVPGADVRFIHGAVAPAHAEMVAAAAGKNVWIVGGGDLAGQFHDAGLLDELIITVAPVTLGRGTPLLPRAIVTPPLHLEQVSRVGTVFAQLRYRVARPGMDEAR